MRTQHGVARHGRLALRTKEGDHRIGKEDAICHVHLRIIRVHQGVEGSSIVAV
jgi:hypothetical protein